MTARILPPPPDETRPWTGGEFAFVTAARALATAAALTIPAVLEARSTADLMADLKHFTDTTTADPLTAADLGAARARVLGELQRRAGSRAWVEGRSS